MTCLHDKPQEFDIVPGSGRLLTRDNCKISGKDFSLPSSAITHSETLHVNISLVTPFSLNLTFEELDDVAMLNSSEILTDVMKLTNKLPLNSLKTELRNLAHIQKMRRLNTVAGGAGLSLSIISFIMGLIITIVLILFCKVGKEKMDEIEADKNNSNNTNQQPRPRSDLSVTFSRGTETTASGMSDAQVDETGTVPMISADRISLIPRSPTASRPEVQPRTRLINLADRHTCQITDSQGLEEVVELENLTLPHDNRSSAP